eukprot:TRINITY_DN5474_c0_g1_i1.p1 TRINITY_DN5474_c0_g1~~TRINITY_DN5474_c0_g1_i1.p1  ORF type:complete len:220 (-),score=54.65 TRINITY_DN5474_c0_g1_i1:50-709(-)
MEGYGESLLGPKIVFVSHDALDWVQLPPADPALFTAVKMISSLRFYGDLSAEYSILLPPREKTEDDDEPPKPTTMIITEEKRLASQIAWMDSELSVVPRGAYYLTAEQLAKKNSNFEGLNPTDSEKLSSFLHLRKAVLLEKKTLLEREGTSRAFDFLDNLSDDIPQGCWTIRNDLSSECTVLRSMMWPGYTAFHCFGTALFGSCYFGNGDRNTVLGFMI